MDFFDFNLDGKLDAFERGAQFAFMDHMMNVHEKEDEDDGIYLDSKSDFSLDREDDGICLNQRSDFSLDREDDGIYLNQRSDFSLDLEDEDYEESNDFDVPFDFEDSSNFGNDSI